MKKSYTILSIVVVLLTILLIVLVQRFKNEKRFTVVSCYNKDMLFNLSKNYKLHGFVNGYATKSAVLAEEGDLLAIGNTFIPYTHIKEDSFFVSEKGDSLSFVNGHVNSIIIDDKDVLLPWFNNMNAATIEHLQCIHFNERIPESYIPFLKKIADVKPHTALMFEQGDTISLVADYLKKANYFSPQYIVVNIEQKEMDVLKSFTTVTCLYINIDDSVITVPLAPMPSLKQCILYSDHLKHISASFFGLNQQLQQLTLLNGIDDYSLIEPLNHLNELSINNTSNSFHTDAVLKKLHQLSVLNFSGSCNFTDSLAALQQLRWLGLPSNTTQQQFNHIAASLNQLQVLVLEGDSNINNLAPLRLMQNLKGLVITDSVQDKVSLYTLKELRYLSIPLNNKSDSTYLKSLQVMLPGCIVVPNSGACLGSGWLLLLLPFTVLMLLFYQWKTRKKSAQC